MGRTLSACALPCRDECPRYSTLCKAGQDDRGKIRDGTNDVEDDMGPMVWRVMGTGSAVLAGVVANVLVTKIWKKAGKDSTLDPRDPRTPWRDAVAFAALTGLAAGAAKVLDDAQGCRVLREVCRSPAAGHAGGRSLTAPARRPGPTQPCRAPRRVRGTICLRSRCMPRAGVRRSGPPDGAGRGHRGRGAPTRCR